MTVMVAGRRRPLATPRTYARPAYGGEPAFATGETTQVARSGATTTSLYLYLQGCRRESVVEPQQGDGG